MTNSTAAMLRLPARQVPGPSKTKSQPRASKRITLRQASNMMAAAVFARKIGTPLNAHATIHWAGTKIGDDPDGRLFAKVREGFDKWLKRHGVPGGLTAIWVRERLSGGSAEVVHCHMLFYLPHPFTRGKRHNLMVGALESLIDRHGKGNYGHFTLKVTFPQNPNGLYLIKGAGPDVWHKFGVPRCWRKPQGSIFGKRCGVTENIGQAARRRWKDRALLDCSAPKANNLEKQPMGMSATSF